MEEWAPVLDALAAAGLTPATLADGVRLGGLVVGPSATLWAVDKLLWSGDGREELWRQLKAEVAGPDRALRWVDGWLHPGRGPLRFALGVLALSAGAILLLLIGFGAWAPEFATAMFQEPVARPYFLRTILTEGLLTVTAVNWIALQVLFATRRGVARAGLPLLPVLAADVALRLALFPLCVAAVYVASAELFGSFSGDPRVALSVVGPTLAGAVRFENITGVYLYACAIAALPLFVAAVADLEARSAVARRVLRVVFFFLPFNGRPILSAALVLGVFFALFALAAGAVFG